LPKAIALAVPDAVLPAAGAPWVDAAWVAIEIAVDAYDLTH
jgi:hypothetical protein